MPRLYNLVLRGEGPGTPSQQASGQTLPQADCPHLSLFSRTPTPPVPPSHTCRGWHGENRARRRQARAPACWCGCWGDVARCAVPPELSLARFPTSAPTPPPTLPRMYFLYSWLLCSALEFQTMLNFLVLRLGISGAAPQMLNV